MLLASGRWSTLALPDNIDNARCGPFDVPWGALERVTLPRTVLYPAAVPDSHNYQEIADAFRIAFSGADTDAGRSRLAGLVASAQAIDDDADPFVYQRRVLLSGPAVGQNQLRYQSDFLLKVFMALSRMTGVVHLRPLFSEVADILFSPAMRQHLDELLAEAARTSPSSSTISRAKLLLDGAFILWTRRYNAQLLTEGGCDRYLMADSSSQHSREFEATWLLTVRKRDLLEALRALNRLIALRICFCLTCGGPCAPGVPQSSPYFP